MAPSQSEQTSNSGRGALFFLISFIAFCAIGLGLYSILMKPKADHARWYADTASYYMAQSMKVEDVQVRKEMQNEARLSFLKALNLDPFNANLWIRFAKVDGVIQGQCAQACSDAFLIAQKLEPSLIREIEATKRFMAQSQMNGESP